MFRPALPKLPKGGMANAVVSNQPSGLAWESAGLRSTFGRSLAPKPSVDWPVLLLSTSGSSATVNGRPVWNVQTPKVCHPPRRRPLPNGKSYAQTPLAERQIVRVAQRETVPHVEIGKPAL